jgi:hypothetical protein
MRGSRRTIEIIPESQLVGECYISVRDRRREIILSATLAEQNACHALEVLDRATHRTRDGPHGLEARVRT